MAAPSWAVVLLADALKPQAAFAGCALSKFQRARAALQVQIQIQW